MYKKLRHTLAQFNELWPRYVVAGRVWSLPTLTEQAALKNVVPIPIEGHKAIESTAHILLQFEREIDQAPGTVRRLPGWFVLSQSMLEPIREINQLKIMLEHAIEQNRIERGLAVTARTRLAREALGDRISLKQLTRHIHAFDAAPRLLSFTWAGHTGKTERMTVGQVRTRLQKLVAQHARHNDGEVEDIPAARALRTLHNLADHARLIKVQKVAPHPRVNIFIGSQSRYDAMVHANLPVFFLAGEKLPNVVGLKVFDSEQRIAVRKHNKAEKRICILQEYGLYIDEDELWGRMSIKPDHSLLTVASTYRERYRDK